MALHTFDLPAGQLADIDIAAAAAIQASKIISAKPWHSQLFAAATTVTALTVEGPIILGATGGLIKMSASINGAIATGGDRTVTVDLHKSTGAGAFATVLSSTIVFTNATVLRTATAAVISSASLVAGDILRVIVTVAGAAGAQATGLNVSLAYYETYA